MLVSALYYPGNFAYSNMSLYSEGSNWNFPEGLYTDIYAGKILRQK